MLADGGGGVSPRTFSSWATDGSGGGSDMAGDFESSTGLDISVVSCIGDMSCKGSGSSEMTDSKASFLKGFFISSGNVVSRRLLAGDSNATLPFSVAKVSYATRDERRYRSKTYWVPEHDG